jgi:hypothetical protein
MSIASFNEAKAVAQSRHQVAITEAHAALDKAVADEKSRQVARYQAASVAWDAVKSDANHPEHDQRHSAFDAAKQPADHRAAHDAHDRAVRNADAAYHAELVELGRAHGVSVR